MCDFIYLTSLNLILNDRKYACTRSGCHNSATVPVRRWLKELTVCSGLFFLQFCTFSTAESCLQFPTEFSRFNLFCSALRLSSSPKSKRVPRWCSSHGVQALFVIVESLFCGGNSVKFVWNTWKLVIKIRFTQWPLKFRCEAGIWQWKSELKAPIEAIHASKVVRCLGREEESAFDPCWRTPGLGVKKRGQWHFWAGLGCVCCGRRAKASSARFPFGPTWWPSDLICTVPFGSKASWPSSCTAKYLSGIKR